MSDRDIDGLVKRLEETARFPNTLRQDWTREMAEAAAAIRELQAERDRLREALMRVDARGDKMIWGEDYEVRAAFDDMADIARAALATPPKSGT